MTDHFISRLPGCHAVTKMQRAAAASSLSSDKMVVTAPESNLTSIRRQCAAVVWIRSNVYTADNVEKMHLAGRASLLLLFGPVQGGNLKAQGRRIDVHVG